MKTAQEARQLMIDSITSDVDQFIAHWQYMRDYQNKDGEYPEKLDDDTWIEQFWLWMEGN